MVQDQQRDNIPERISLLGLTVASPSFLVQLVIVFLASVVGPGPLHVNAQEKSALNERLPELYRLPNGEGWFGIERTPSADRLMVLDTLFGTELQTLWRDLVPIDFRTTERGREDSIAVMLAHPGGSSLLYRVRIGETILLEPIWENRGKGFDRIVGIFLPFSSNPVVALAGDSGIAGIQLDGTEAYIHKGLIRATLPSSKKASYLHFLESFGDRSFFGTINLIDGSIISNKQVDGSGHGLLLRSESDGAPQTLLLGLSDPPSFYRIRESSNGFQVQHSVDRFPDAAVGLDKPGSFALIYNALPSIMALRIDKKASLSPLYYPLSTPFQSVVSNKDYVILVCKDSAVVYNKELDYLCRVPAVGGIRVRLLRLDSSDQSYLLISENGSVGIKITPDPWGWFYTVQTELLTGLGVLLLLLVLLFFFRRYHLMRAMYMNLVSGSEAAGLIITSRNGKVITLNSTARRYLGIEGTTAVKRHLNFALADKQMVPIAERCRRLLQYSEPFQTELNLTREKTALTLHFIGRPLYGRYGATKGFIITIDDITRVIEQDRLVNWASVAHHIAHEMKTPLGVVRTSAESLRYELAGLNASGKTFSIAGRIMRQSVRLKGIVDDLLTVARTEELKHVDVDVSLLLSSLVDDMQEFIPGTTQLLFNQEGNDFRLECDPDQLTIAVRNVIDNAQQAIGEREGGKIEVALEGLNDSINLIITDNGIGMSKETLARLFQPYYTEKEGGSGIGTVIIKKVIEGHGGKVGVESEVGVGTTFKLSLPR